MNVFRIVGDVSHYAAIVTIFLKIITSKSCKGISGRTQILYLLVFLTRYIDIFFHFISLYNTGIKIFFIASSITNIYLTIVKYKGTISSDIDNFRIELLIIPTAILAVLVNHEFALMEILWTFSSESVYLPHIAIELILFQFTLRVLPSCLSYQSLARVRAQRWTELSCFTWQVWQVTKYSTFSTGCTGKLISRKKVFGKINNKTLMFQVSQ